jgi:tRNA (cmo5U34)-methyltransferase
MSDEIKNGFDQIAHQYNDARKTLIPCYEQFYGIITELAHSNLPKPTIADLGAGTGLLSSLLLQKFPAASFTLIDISGNMLDIARQRFVNQNQFQYFEADYATFDFPGTYDMVVSSLSIHHLDDKEKWALYKKIFIMLKPGGLFINGDLIRGVNPETNQMYLDQWLDKIEKSSLDQAEKEAAYYRMTFDKPATVPENLYNMRKAGFVDVDIFYKCYNFAILYGRKP